MIQLIEPNPNIPCVPGWCLQYVRQTFGLPVVEPSATAGWNNAKYRHADRNFPEGVWVPLWFAIPGIPEGHVVLRAPDGSIYSTSTPGNTPYHHPSLEHLIWYYGPRVQPQYQLELQYLGWSEDISNARVVGEGTIQLSSTGITQLQEEDMANVSDTQLQRLLDAADRIMGRDAQRYLFLDAADNRIKPCEPGTPGSWAARSADVGDILGLLYQGQDGTKRTVDEVSAAYHQSEASADQRAADLRSLMASLPASDLAASIPDNLAQDVVDALAARLKGN